MNPFKSFRSTKSVRSQPGRELSQAELIAVSGGAPGQMNPIHAPSPHPIVYVPIINPFPFRRLPG